MTPKDDHTLRFTCPRCMAPLKARPASAGTQKRCPRCQLLVTVPEKTLLAPAVEENPLKREGPLPASQPAYIPVTCPHCRTRVYGAAELVGQELICPDCGTAMIVPPPAPPVVAPPVVALSVEPAEQRTTEEGLIRIQCLLCGTLMYATEDQIGQKIICPDCQVPAIVTRPIKAPPKQVRSAGEVGEYALAGESGRSAGGPPVEEQGGVTVSCPLCHKQLRAGLDQIGAKLACPDCGTVLIVPPPPPPVATGREAESSGDVGQAGWSGANVWGNGPISATPLPAAKVARAAAAADRELELDHQRPKLHRWLFLDGTFTFPFTVGTLAFTFVLATWVMLPIWLGLKAIELANIESHDTWFGSIVPGAFAVFLGTMWFALASACALAVIRDTSNGCDKIENWPDMEFVDWITEPLFLFNSVCLSMLPGVGVVWLETKLVEVNAGVGVLAFFLFPIVLLSMLDKNSRLVALSPAVVRTFWMAWTGWVRFYFFAALLTAAIVAIVIKAFAIGPTVGVITAAIGLGVGWLIYFRMLGRLAWYCTVRTAVAEPEEPEAEGENGPDEDDALLHDDGPLASSGRM